MSKAGKRTDTCTYVRKAVRILSRSPWSGISRCCVLEEASRYGMTSLWSKGSNCGWISFQWQCRLDKFLWQSWRQCMHHRQRMPSFKTKYGTITLIPRMDHVWSCMIRQTLICQHLAQETWTGLCIMHTMACAVQKQVLPCSFATGFLACPWLQVTATITNRSSIQWF